MAADAPPRAARLATPSWLDARLVLGVLLVLVSVVVGARVLSAAERTDLVWAAAGDIAPGAVLDGDDLVPAEVRLQGAGGGYLDATQPPPVGFVVQRGLLAGELVPLRALADPAEAELRQVTVSVAGGDAPPDLRSGDLVDVYLTPARDAAAAPQEVGSTRRVLQRVAVASVPDTGGFAAGGDTRAVVLNVRPGDVLALVTATAQGAIDLVRLPVDGLARPEPVQAAG